MVIERSSMAVASYGSRISKPRKRGASYPPEPQTPAVPAARLRLVSEPGAGSFKRPRRDPSNVAKGQELESERTTRRSQ